MSKVPLMYPVITPYHHSFLIESGTIDTDSVLTHLFSMDGSLGSSWCPHTYHQELMAARECWWCWSISYRPHIWKKTSSCGFKLEEILAVSLSKMRGSIIAEMSLMTNNTNDYLRLMEMSLKVKEIICWFNVMIGCCFV